MNPQTREAIAKAVEALDREIESHSYRLVNATSTEFRNDLKKRRENCLQAIAAFRAIDEAEVTPPTDDLVTAGDEVIRCYHGFHEAIEQHTGKPYPWEPIVSAIEAWDAAKARMKPTNTTITDEQR